MELLVHGVGGTTPETMLDDPHIVQLTGDTVAGTYRRWSDRHAEQHPDQYRDGAVEEAYSWGGLTSGSAGRALWLLLLPFMLANLAHWMRPAAPRSAPAQKHYDLAVRLIALSLTVLLTACACEVALDLIGWQCAGVSGCAARHSWLGFAAATHGGWWGRPGRRLALAALGPLALVAVLWWLSRLTWAGYEAQRPASGGSRTDVPPMQMPGFWYGMRLVRRLRVVHVASGLVTTALAVLLPVLAEDRRTGSALAAADWTLAALLAALAVGALAALVRSTRTETEQDDRPDSLPLRALHWTALGLLALVLLDAAWSRRGWQSAGHLPGVAALVDALCLLQLALVLLLAAAALGLRRSGRAAAPPAADPVVTDPAVSDPLVTVPEVLVPGPGRSVPGGDEAFGGPDGAVLHGLGGPVTAMLGVGLGNLFTAGSTVWAAQWLMGKGTLGVTLPGPPPLLTWHSTGLPVLALLFLAPAGVLLVRMLRQKHALEPQIESAYATGPRGSRTRTAQIAAALARARLLEGGPLLVGSLATLAFALAAGSAAGALGAGRAPALAAAHAPTVVRYAATGLQALGGWLVAAFAVALVALGERAYKNLSTRRTVGVLWDIGTFWPRAAHPFAPPCYAERAVPDLDWRIRTWLAGDDRRRLVLSGHSQGTVLAAAALWQLAPGTRARVALLTYGCPLHRLYGRFFPGFMGTGDLRQLHRSTPYWRNLFRVTDPIGGPVRVPVPTGERSVDAPPFVDPLAYDRDAAHPLPVPIQAHSNYRDDPQFIRERDSLLRQL
ncbi:hypothetical protein GXW83_11645 [Streptacidiphilus sp. PB12-B1b]|nr:hypothetical protein GXW83_11645 [Streptacidiphilus sp. PB12-B1b]